MKVGALSPAQLPLHLEAVKMEKEEDEDDAWRSELWPNLPIYSPATHPLPLGDGHGCRDPEICCWGLRVSGFPPCRPPWGMGRVWGRVWLHLMYPDVEYLPASFQIISYVLSANWSFSAPESISESDLRWPKLFRAMD